MGSEGLPSPVPPPRLASPPACGPESHAPLSSTPLLSAVQRLPVASRPAPALAQRGTERQVLVPWRPRGARELTDPKHLPLVSGAQLCCGCSGRLIPSFVILPFFVLPFPSSVALSIFSVLRCKDSFFKCNTCASTATPRIL